jgi:hypothetical protein
VDDVSFQTREIDAVKRLSSDKSRIAVWWGDNDMQIVLFAAGLPSSSVLMGKANEAAST